MSRLVRLTGADVMRINRASRRPGVLLQYRFVEDPTADPKDWVLSDWSDALRGLMDPRGPKTFEIWATANQKVVATWAPNPVIARQVSELMRVFNPEAEAIAPPTNFPALRPGSLARVARLRPRRNSHYPIEFRFSRQTQRSRTFGGGLAGQVSPVHHVLTSLPRIPDGSLLVIQVAYRENPYYWRLNPWVHLGILPLGHDEHALEEKRKHRGTYYADIRILEVHAKPERARINLCREVSHAYGIYDWSRSNRLHYTTFWAWGRRRVVRFIRAMRERRLDQFKLRFRNRPHYCDRELAALIHPPPAGTHIPDLAYTRVTPHAASTTARGRAEAYQRSLQDLQRSADATQPGAGSHGQVRRLRAAEAREHLRRLQGGPP